MTTEPVTAGPGATVALTRVGTPQDPQTARDDVSAMAAGLETLTALLDEPLRQLRAGETVLIKPNLFKAEPGFHVSPALLTALARAVAATGARPVVAERTQAIHEVLAGHEVHRYARVVSLDDLPLRMTVIEGARSLRIPVVMPELVLDCDRFISVPQPRTHAAVLYSNALKNLVGLFPGYTTRLVHLAGVDESVVDLNLMRPHDLVVCDGTVVVEGNYPVNGVPRPVGFLAASRNALALDSVVATLSGFEPAEVPHLVDAHRRGLGPLDLCDIELRGEPLDRLRFDMVRAPTRVPASPNLRVYAERACPACRRYLAGALTEVAAELEAWGGEMTVLAGPQPDPPHPVHGAVVLVGNCLYEGRDQGIYVEGCPPRAIQVAAFRYAMGQPVTELERSQFRVPDAPPGSVGTVVPGSVVADSVVPGSAVAAGAPPPPTVPG